MMYCSNCGVEAEGSYCWQCGAKLKPDFGNMRDNDWTEEIRYDVLLHFSEVRDLIAQYADQKQSRISGEEFLKLCDMAFEPLSGVSLSKLASIVHPIYSKLGVKTGKTKSETLLFPPGKILVTLLCSLAKNGQPIRKVQQAEDGCFLEASIPSDMWSFEGSLLITVKRLSSGGTFVEAATVIRGQLFDWGKSKRCLEQLFADLNTPVSSG